MLSHKLTAIQAAEHGLALSLAITRLLLGVPSLQHEYVGCLVDSELDRDFVHQTKLVDTVGMTLEMCQARCFRLNYDFMGLQVNCWSLFRLC